MSELKIQRHILAPDYVVMKRTVITSAQLLALNTTPKVIVPAPPANRYLALMGVIINKPAGTAYAGIAAGEDLSIKYTNAAGLEVAQCETTNFLDQVTNQSRWVWPHAVASAASDVAVVAGAALVLHLLVGNITTGTSPLIVHTYYRMSPKLA